jgi:hypothetical protein
MSTNKLTMPMFNEQQGHQVVQTLWKQAKAHLSAGRRMVMTLAPETRSTAQNARLWAMLAEISAQVDWYGRKLSPEEWKHVFSASLKKQDVVPGLDGGFVVLGLSTSKMTKGEMADLQTLMEAFGAQKGVRFTATEEYTE